MGRKRYSEEKQKEAVKALVLNKMDYNLTAKQLKIGTSSLQRWAEKYPEIVSSGKADITARMLKEGDDAQDSFIKKVMAGKTMAIERILELVPTEKSIATLLSVVETLNAVTGGGNVSTNTNSIFLQINQQLNQVNNE